ncbi:hypothetical protein HELRODRAFT_170905 [Helobdella robusta]|uniref:Uncharacterized protein n=1 Tax=Helobdella robusta TaxID=6412 RepID=T1F3K9_HELRO|nr:hypothetical protein HELRODRAFT_170905 [Helobdella robusta]ESO06875.1 hypothetical protein HELRODRAFT_170905 [Helobdella robusta]
MSKQPQETQHIFSYIAVLNLCGAVNFFRSSKINKSVSKAPFPRCSTTVLGEFFNSWVLKSTLNFVRNEKVVRKGSREFQKNGPEKAKADLATEDSTRIKKY